MKLTYYYNLYLSTSLDKPSTKESILEELKENKLDKRLYVLVLSKNPDNNLEFFKVSYLQQEIYQEQSFFVVGVAKDYEEAKDLVLKITKDVVTYTGEAKIREYFKT